MKENIDHDEDTVAGGVAVVVGTMEVTVEMIVSATDEAMVNGDSS